MCATFTITAELSRQGLLEAKDAIDRLLDQRRSSTPPAKADDEDLVERKVRLFREWAGQKSWDFLYTIANSFAANEEFTFDELSRVFHVSVATVKSWHRSASKPMNRVDSALADGSIVLPKMLNARWDGERQHYWLSKEMRDAILAAGA